METIETRPLGRAIIDTRVVRVPPSKIEVKNGCTVYIEDGAEEPIPLYNNGIRPEEPSPVVYDAFEKGAAEFIHTLRTKIQTLSEARRAAIVLKRWGLNPDLVKLMDFPSQSPQQPDGDL